MNGIERITDKIKADAQAELDALRAEQEAQFVQQEADGRMLAEQQYQALSAQIKRESALQMERLKSAVDMDAKKQTLALKQQLIGEAFALAEQKLAAMEGEPYVKLLAELAAGGASGERTEIVLSQQDRAAYGQAITDQANALLAGRGIAGTLTLSGECRPTGGGLFLKNERMEINCTFSALVSRQREALASDVAKLLFC